ncbi:MAG: T9SS type A sorting domain-containing protein [Ignavibacterium album]|nr:T9SS type A sorting domain-containing protein [Ignavibacterium album]
MFFIHILIEKIYKLKSIFCILVSAIIIFLNGGISLAQQYWGEQMFSTYSNSLINGEVGTLYTARTVDIQDNKMYVAERYGITVVDISNPSSPQLLGSIATPDVSRRIVANNNLIYTVGELGLTIVDAAIPNSPVILSFTPLRIDEKGCDITLADNLLFLSSYSRIYAYDVSAPTVPVLISSLFIQQPDYGIHITKHPRQNILYCAVNHSPGSFQVVDISNPENMQILTSINLNRTGIIYSPPAISGNRLFVIETLKIHSFDITNPSNPTLLYSAAPRLSHYSFVVGDTVLFAAHQQARWVAYSINNDNFPQFLSEYGNTNIWGIGYGIAKLHNNYMYLRNYGRSNEYAGWNVKIVDISDPMNATITGTIQSPNAGFSVTHTILKRGDQKYALVAQRNTVHTAAGLTSSKGILRIMNITDPSNPVLMSSVDFDGTPDGIIANDSIVVVRTNSTGAGIPLYDIMLRVFAITNLNDPIQTQAIFYRDFPTTINNLRLFEGKLYIPKGNGLAVYKINNDYTITQLGSSSVPNSKGLQSLELRRRGNSIFAYLAAGGGIGGGFVIFNATNPNAMYIVSAFDTPGDAIDIALQDNYAYLSDYNSIYIFDIKDNQTVPVNNFPIVGNATTIKIANNLMFLNVEEGGEFYNGNIQIYDINDPVFPVYKGTYLSRYTQTFSLSEDCREFYLAHYYSFDVKRCLFNFKPLTFNLQLPANNSSVVSESIDFAWRESYDANDDPLTYTLKLWNSTFSTTITVNSDTTYTLSGVQLPNGSYNWTVSVSDGEFEIASVDTFSFSFSYIPVELISFTAQTQGSKVVLNWSTASETNNQGFEVERQAGNQHSGVWEKIGYVSGHGTTTEPRFYSFADENLSTGTYMYRLKQIDFDGSFEYSSEIEASVFSPKEFALNQNYPNPFNPNTRITFDLPVESAVTLQIFNSLGELIWQQEQSNLSAGSHSVTWDGKDNLGNSLTSGIYFLKMQANVNSSVNGDFYKSIKMMLLK